jgi:hypothetical protein
LEKKLLRKKNAMVTERQTIAVLISFAVTFILYVLIMNVTPMTRLAMGTDGLDPSLDYATLAGITIATLCAIYYLSFRNKPRHSDDFTNDNQKFFPR